MSKERILETIGQVKEEFIEEAAPKGLLDEGFSEEKQAKIVFGKAKIYRFVKWGALAACLCLIAGLGMKMNLFSAAKNDTAFEMKDAMMNQSAEMESVMEETKADYGANMENNADSDYATGEYITSAGNGNVTEDTAASTKTTTADSVVSDKGFPDWGLTLSVKNVTSTGLTLVVTQSGGNPTGELQTGEPYRLIALVDGTWKTVEELPLPECVDARGWNGIAYLLPKGETREFDINWKWMFGELPSGTYRLIKEFMDFRTTANYDTFEYWIEFEIQ